MASLVCDNREKQTESSNSLRLEEPEAGGLKFWLKEYFGVDLRVLAISRILLALLVIIQLLSILPDLDAFFSPEGVLGVDNPPSSAKPLPVFVIHLIFAFFLLVGFKTRASSLVVWFLYLLLISRGSMIIHSGDLLLLLMLFWGIFIPWGVRFSMDNLSEKKEFLPKKVLSVGTAAFILQMPLIYFFTGLIKLTDPSWSENFSAIFYALTPTYISYGGQLLLKLNTSFLETLTVFILFLEILGPVFLFLPFYPFFFRWLRVNLLPIVRTVLFSVFLLFQLSLAFALSLGPFPFISIVSLIPILPSSLFDKAILPRKQGKREMRLKIFYDGDCSFCEKTINITGNLGLLSKAWVRKAQEYPEALTLMREKNSWVVIDKNSKEFFKFEALLSIFKNNILTKPFYFLCQSRWIKKIGNSLYEKVAGNRARASFFLSLLIKGYPWRTPPWLSFTCLFFLVLAITSNLASIGIVSMPDYLHKLERLLLLEQRWIMFSGPVIQVGYFKTEGEVTDGRWVNLSKYGGPVRKGFDFFQMDRDDSQPLIASKISKNYHWRKYFANLRSRDPVYFESYARYLCFAWRKNLPQEPVLKTVRINFISNDRNYSIEAEYGKEWREENLYNYKC
ncbi:MAG: hypothetical protein G01um1014107_298 [Parcubacteria group bacterium Gr01-1014_107]|nr:MAG: hypothetical protein G01um1014107_298 [Parcubacteria group bacterium Gr01-1014_107]